MTKKRWGDPDKRMARAVDLRAQGWSLRQIGTHLAVDEKTIRNDLARHRKEQAATAPARPALRLIQGAESVRSQGAEFGPDSAPEVRTDSAPRGA